MMILSDEEALDRLKEAIEQCGSAAQFAARIGVSPAFVSQVASGKSKISGAIATYLGLKKVNAYELTGPKKSPEQEQYEKDRKVYLEQMGVDIRPFRKGFRIRG